MSSRSLQDIVESGARVSKRELFAALHAEGLDALPTSKPTHFKVRCEHGIVFIATRRDVVLPVYVSRIAKAVGLNRGGKDE